MRVRETKTYNKSKSTTHMTNLDHPQTMQTKRTITQMRLMTTTVTDTSPEVEEQTAVATPQLFEPRLQQSIFPQSSNQPPTSSVAFPTSSPSSSEATATTTTSPVIITLKSSSKTPESPPTPMELTHIFQQRRTSTTRLCTCVELFFPLSNR